MTRTDLTAVFCCTLLLLPNATAAPIQRSQPTPSADPVLHSLNRFTFGPRPGDEARVRSMGVDAWFEQQLYPEKISDADLDLRLSEFPALQLSQQDLTRRFPTPALVRRIAYGQGPAFDLPRGPIERTVLYDQAAYLKMTKGEKAENKTPVQQTQSSGEDTMQSPAMQNNPQAAAAVEDFRKGQANIVAMPRQQADQILALAPDARFNAVLALPPDQLYGFLKTIRFNQATVAAGAPAATQLLDGMSPQQRETLLSLHGSNPVISGEVLQARLLRDIYSNRQLEAVMTDFWLNHFNVFIGKNQNEIYTLPTYERETIRKHALGHFEDLLIATAESPAMLLYLDNFQSIGPNSVASQRGSRRGAKNTGLNENYARELMELHTLGVNGGYTQHDVTEVAKVFTGWTVDNGTYTRAAQSVRARRFELPLPQGHDGFLFTPNRHEPGSKQVLGQTIGEGGVNEGLQVLHMLATSPATAKFISTKLAVRFVADDPSPELVTAMAKTFLSTRGDIREVLRTMFHSPQFNAPSSYRAKLKTPLEYVVSAARASNAQIENALPLAQSLRTLGMPLYGMKTPNGYSWTQAPWLSTSALVNRMNFALVFSTNRLPGANVDWQAALNTSPSVHPASFTLDASDQATSKERQLEQIILGFPASSQTRQTVLSQQGEEAAQKAAQQFRLAPQSDISAEDAMVQQGSQMKRERIPGAARPKAMQALWLQRKTPSDPQAAAMAGLLLGSPEFQRR